MAAPPGLVAVAEFLSLAEETALLDRVNASPWETTLSRRVQHYGYRYTYRHTAPSVEVPPVPPVPAWALELYAKCLAAAAAHNVDVSTPLDALQVIVNEYLPGQGINAHVDDPVKFGAWVITVSLGSACEMEFASKKTGAKFRATLPPRSMYAMTGESRYQWTHAIAGRKTDPSPAGSHRVPRSTRVSITFRAKA